MRKKQPEFSEKQLELMVSYARQLLQLPVAQRENFCAWVKVETYSQAIAEGMNHTAAQNLGKRTDKFTRSLVFLFEETGGNERWGESTIDRD